MKSFLGKKFGRLLVISSTNKTYHCRCRCDCGNETLVYIYNLTRGQTTSCGCYKNEKIRQNSTTHGKCYSGEYVSWKSMIYRCTNPRNSWYAKAGITVCERWLNSFENFFSDMGNKPSLKHSIDRWPDKNGNYEPGNCRWATHLQQCNNKKKNRMLCFMGEEDTSSNWGRRLGIPSYKILQRIDRDGWSIERALTAR